MKRLNVAVSDETYEAIAKLVKNTDASSISDLLRRSLKTYRWMHEEKKNGARILSKKDGDSHVKELVGI